MANKECTYCSIFHLQLAVYKKRNEKVDTNGSWKEIATKLFLCGLCFSERNHWRRNWAVFHISVIAKTGHKHKQCFMEGQTCIQTHYHLNLLWPTRGYTFMLIIVCLNTQLALHRKLPEMLRLSQNVSHLYEYGPRLLRFTHNVVCKLYIFEIKGKDGDSLSGSLHYTSVLCYHFV